MNYVRTSSGSMMAITLKKHKVISVKKPAVQVKQKKLHDYTKLK